MVQLLLGSGSQAYRFRVANAGVEHAFCVMLCVKNDKRCENEGILTALGKLFRIVHIGEGGGAAVFLCHCNI